MKPKKLKNRRSISRMDLFPKKCLKEDSETQAMYEAIKKKFPDKRLRAQYIRDLIHGLDTTESQEHTREFISPEEAEITHAEAAKNRHQIKIEN